MKLVGQIVLLLVLPSVGLAQATQPGMQQAVRPAAQVVGPAKAPQLSPQAAYDQAMIPLTVTRNAITNWSDAEQAALAVALKQSATECTARTPADYNGDDLIALARLCAFGQVWSEVGAAALRYINSDEAEKPQLGLAYAFNLSAKLQSKDVNGMVIAAQTMLTAVPYEAVEDTAFNATLRYLELVYTNEALVLYAYRERVVLAALKADKPSLPRHLLYADGVAMAMMQQYMGQPGDAKGTMAMLDEALGDTAGLAPDDALPIADTRRQYGLLGKPLPKIVYELSLYDVRETPRLDENYGDGAALLLFPEWCAQCVRSAEGLRDAMMRIGNNGFRVAALMAGEVPDKTTLVPPKVPVRRTVPAAPEQPPATKTAAQMLLHTPTLIVPPETLHIFVADDFPFLIVVDHAGIVRFLGTATETALRQGDFVDQVLGHVAEVWPKQVQKAP